MSPMAKFRTVIPFFFRIGSASFRRRMLEIIPLTITRRALKISDTIQRCSKEIFEAKNSALQEGDEAVTRQFGEGRDIMSKLRQYLSRGSESASAYSY